MNTGGKKVYGYLKADVKAIVNGIVDELAKEEKVAECYKQWLESKSEILHYYKDADAEQLPLSEQKELKSIKNMVIREAVRYGEGYLYTEDEGLEDLETEREEMDADDSEVSEDMAEVPADYSDAEPETEEPDSQEFYAKWTDAYKEAREYLYGTSEMEPDEEAAYEIMKEEAEQGNAYAMADMGKMYAQGIFVEADKAKAQEWYEKSLKAMLIVEGRKENTYLEYRIGKCISMAWELRRICRRQPSGLGWHQVKSISTPYIPLACCICMAKVWSRTKRKPVSCFSVPIKRAILTHPLNWENCMKLEEEARGIRIWRGSATG